MTEINTTEPILNSSKQEPSPSWSSRQTHLITYAVARAWATASGAFLRIWPVYLGLAVLFEIVFQYNQTLLALAEQSGIQEGPYMALKLSQFLFGTAWLAVSTILVPLGFVRATQKTPLPLMPFVARHAGPLTIEGLRAFASVLLWTLAFLIPGFVRLLRLQFVPLVVMFAADYEKGEVDALVRSHNLTRFYMGGLIFLWLLIAVPSFFLQGWHSNYPLLTSPLMAVLSWSLLMGLDFFSNLLFMTSYEYLNAHPALPAPSTRPVVAELAVEREGQP